jgi:hypothetical protein
MELVAFLGNDKENWGQLTGLIKRMEYEKAILVRDKGVVGFPSGGKVELVSVDSSRPLLELRDEIIDKLKNKLAGDFEVACSLASGNGKEHMALIAGLLTIPVGVRFVVFTKDGVKLIN